ncbi:hypothetical protein Tco_0069203, partial [Tanacetum coccineum]
DDDDDEESSIPLKDIITSGLPSCVAVTLVLSTEEPVDSLIMEDEHLDTIPATESEEIFEIGKCSTKMYLKHHEKQVKDILNYLDELSFHRIEKIEEGRIDRMNIRRNSDELKIELERIRTQIIKFQRKKLG